MEVHINDLLKIAIDRGSSDLHLKVGSHPVIRVDGRLLPTITGDGTDGSTDPSHDRTSTSAPNSPPASSPSTTTDRSFGRDPRRDRTTDTSRW